MKIKRDSLDILFMKYLRLRDKVCQCCGSGGDNLQVSHFWGRRIQNTRYDDDNCDLLCFGCHGYFTANPKLYTDWKLKRLSQDKFDLLEIRASRVPKHKVDKESIKLYLKEMIKRMEKE